MNKRSGLNVLLASILVLMLFAMPAHAVGNLTVATVTTSPLNQSGYIATSVTFTTNATDYTGIFTSAILTFDTTNYTMHNVTANVTNSSSGVSFQYVVTGVQEGYHTFLVTVADSDETNQSSTAAKGYLLNHPFTASYVGADLGKIPIDFLGWLFANFVNYAGLAALAVLLVGVVWAFGRI